MKKKRLLLVNHCSDLFGGANDDFIRILKYFSNKKDEYFIHGIFPEGPNSVNYAEYCDEWDTYTCGFFPISADNLLHYYGYIKLYFIQKKEFEKILKGKEFDLCILNVVVMLWLAVWIKSRNIKCIIFIREFIRPVFLRKLYHKIISRFGDYFIAVSDLLEKVFVKDSGKKNIKVLYSSLEKNLDYAKYHDEFMNQINELNLSGIIESTKTKIVHVGAINENKNQLLILKALNILKNRDNAKLPLVFFIGEGKNNNYFRKLKHYSLSNKLNDNCFFLDARNKNFIYNFFQFMDLMIISSVSEGLPLVLVEALRFKLPVISTKAGGITDIIVNDYNGILINRDAHSLADNIEKLANDKILCTQLTENGLKTYTNKFNLENNMKELENIVINLMKD